MAKPRRSYRSVNSWPAWGLYKNGGKLVASCRATDMMEAAWVFSRHNDSHPEHKVIGDYIEEINA